MSKALGAFGKNKNADVSNKVLQFLYQATEPKNMMEIWRVVVDDLEKLDDLSNILAKLKHAERIQTVKVNDKVGYLPKFPKPKADVILITSAPAKEKTGG